MAETVVDELLKRIPTECEVRAKLAENIREAAILRSLLRVAKKKSDADSRTHTQGKSVQNAP